LDRKRKRSSSPRPPAGKRARGSAPIGTRGASAKAKRANPAKSDAVAPTDPPTGPTPEEQAATFIAMLDQMEAQISNFQHHDPNDIRRIAAIARFAPELVVSTLSTTMSFPPAAQRNLFDNDKGQMALRRKSALQPVIQRLGALKDGLQFTVNSDLAEAGSQALDVYTWAKSYVKRPDAKALIPYVAAMSQVVKKVINHRKSRSTPAPAPAPAPSPSPAPTQLPPGAQGFLASRTVPSKPAGEEELSDRFDEALDRAVKE